VPCHRFASVSSALPSRRPTRTRCVASAGSPDRSTTPAPIPSRTSGRRSRRRWRGRATRSRMKLVAHRYKTETKQKQKNKQMQIVRYSSFCCHFFLYTHTLNPTQPPPLKTHTHTDQYPYHRNSLLGGR